MPIKDRDLGKYKRPGIFIEEIDASVIELPVQDVLVNMVPGFSKKGPFNAPIYVTNPNDFEAIFGEDDRRLENKGSYFHKTVRQMLKSGPVWALNLLSTDPNRDKLEWQSISVSAQYENSSVMSTAYELFFNRQDFWERDTDAFLNIVKNNNGGVQDDNRLFHITNMGDKDITVFMFKSDITGFDITAEDWYGGRDKVPTYIDYREWMSDYIVSVVVIAGDWTDYRTLANDTTFSTYFNKNGLIKGQVSNFVNERTVTVLASYDVSLIPYFKDLNDRDMYIKNVINNNTDKTGLFCTYNEDALLEADFKLGNLDIMGDVLVGQDFTSINFMSYNATLKESLVYSNKYLDSANNVFTNIATPLNNLTVSGGTRTGAYTNGHTYGIYIDSVNGTTGSTTTTFDFDITTTSYPYYVLNGSVYEPSFGTATLSSVTQTTIYASRVDVLYLTSDNTQISVLYGSEGTSNLSLPTATAPNYTYSLNSTIILGSVSHIKSGNTYTAVYTPVTVGSTSTVDQYGSMTMGYVPIDSFEFTSVTGTYIDNYLQMEFLGTSGMTGVYNDYNYLRMNHLFNEMDTYVTTDKTVLIKDGEPFEKTSSADTVVINGVTITGLTYTVDSGLDYVPGDIVTVRVSGTTSGVTGAVTSYSSTILILSATTLTDISTISEDGTSALPYLGDTGSTFDVTGLPTDLGLYSGSTVTVVNEDSLGFSGTINTYATGEINVNIDSFVGGAASGLTGGTWTVTSTQPYQSASLWTIQLESEGNVSFATSDKTPITGRAVVDSTSTTNALVRLYVEVPSDYISGTDTAFLIYYNDDEFVLQDDNTARLKTVYQEVTQIPTVTLDGDTYNVGVVGKYSTFYQNYYNGIINNLDYFWTSNDSGSTTPNDDKVYLKMFVDQSAVLTVDFMTYDGSTYIYKAVDDWNSDYTKQLIIYSDKSNWRQSVEIESWVGDDLTTVQQISIDKTRYSEIKRGDFLEAYYDITNWQSGGAGYLEGSEPRKFTRIINIRNNTNDTSLKTLYTDAPIRLTDTNMLSGTSSGQSSATVDYQTFTYQSVDVYVDEYKGLKISPFTVHQDSIPNGTDSRQNAILDVLTLDNNLAKALADKNKISWRYLVDPWGLGLQPSDGVGCKQQLVDLTGLKLNALGFINMPSAKDFRNSSNPSFVNTDGSLNMEYVRKGADESKNPDYLYQFATRHGQVDGRSTAGYFFPYVRIYDNGIPKWFPPASYAATTYMQKFVSNVAGFVPWTICAGITNGRINGITKTEMDFNGTDLENLHQMGANPIVYKLNNGYCINDESTAQVFPFSSLSFLHSREVLIELENRLYDMLLRYQWAFNTPEIRAEIKYRADKICKEMLDADAFYDFKNICDETNNTDYIIDLQMGVLDTYVEIIKGMGIIVNNITILKKGDIQSGGFSPQ